MSKATINQQAGKSGKAVMDFYQKMMKLDHVQALSR